MNNTRSLRDEQLTEEDTQVLRKKRKKKRRKRIWIGVAALFSILLFFVARGIFDVFQFMDAVYNPVETDDLRDGQGIRIGEDSISFLILGLDEDRSDTMMVAVVNPTLGYSYLVSIARDTYVEIIGHGSRTRINHAYAYGGAAMAINTVQAFLDVPIDFYVSIDMLGFVPLIEAVGGVHVYNDTIAFSEHGFNFPLGPVHLTSGEMALVYSRSRTFDDDYGRQQRQRHVINALVSEMAGVASVARYQQILDAAGQHMKMDLSLGDMVSISTGNAAALRNIESLELRGYGQNIRGMALQVVPDYRRLEMSQRLRRHLELDY